MEEQEPSPTSPDFPLPSDLIQRISRPFWGPFIPPGIFWEAYLSGDLRDQNTCTSREGGMLTPSALWTAGAILI